MEKFYHVRIEVSPGIIIKKVMRREGNPKDLTIDVAMAEIVRQQNLIMERSGEPAMPRGKVTITEWGAEDPPPSPSPTQGVEVLKLLPQGETQYAI